jgi:hypothetical protein
VANENADKTRPKQRTARKGAKRLICPRNLIPRLVFLIQVGAAYRTCHMNVVKNSQIDPCMAFNMPNIPDELAHLPG